MPNWIEGTLKLRGSKGKLKKFFDNAIKPNDLQEKNCQKSIICHQYEEDYEYTIYEDAYIEGTRRAFISEAYDVYLYSDYSVVCVPIKQAWNFKVEEWRKLSEKYEIDIRLYGFECGMEFCQELVIVNGEVTVENTIQYEDWLWECPMPLMGG